MESEHPNRPSLFGDIDGLSFCKFISQWFDHTIHPVVRRIVLKEIHSTRSEAVTELTNALAPAEAYLEENPYLAGSAPRYSDYILVSALLWVTKTTDVELVAPNTAIYKWFNNCMDLYHSCKN